jgi:S-adenosylmethionine hydrolase
MKHPIPVITLLTDFGLRDGYVGMMKGVMLGIHSPLTLVDLSHQIPAQDVHAANLQLVQVIPYFPQGTIHLAVVDPGVGTERGAIAIECSLGYLVGPDNGIFTDILARFPAQRVVRLNRVQYWRTPHPSPTFHGRDIFAPIAAHLACGVDLRILGAPMAPEALVRLPPLPYRVLGPQQVQGCIQHIDGFGNLITNIPGTVLENAQTWQVHIQSRVINPVIDQVIGGASTYGKKAKGELLALVGSHGWVEVAVNGGSAEAVLGVGVGEPLQVKWT